MKIGRVNGVVCGINIKQEIKNDLNVGIAYDASVLMHGQENKCVFPVGNGMWRT